MTQLRALAHYKCLPQIAGWKALIVAFGARAPYAMIPLGVLTAVSASSGSVATGGLATGVTALSTAIAGPLIGKWTDRRGQALPLHVLTPFNAVLLLGLFLSVYFVTPLPVVLLFGMLAGLTSLPIGSFTRSRWIANTRYPHELSVALSYESMADELVFVLGPALVGVLASLVFPSAPLLVAFLLVASVGMVFAFSAESTAASASIPEGGAAQVRVFPVLLTILPTIIAMTTIGMLFGGIQAAITARAGTYDMPSASGLIYSVVGLGSAIMAILTVLIPEWISLPKRLSIAGFGILVTVGLTAFAPSVLWNLPILFSIGLFIGPAMVTAFTITESLAPANGVAIAMTAMQSSITVGVSVGAAVGGAIAQSHGDFAAFITTALTGIIIALVGFYLSTKKSDEKQVVL
ncbi:transporter, major facilitator family protein [Gleimia coleocanis DSM 15436]|uniref:Transporter, major facilitator family protein n=1 Tax=Gleimia coleocanis DSM 15436 TaxID=525245 RepID=C0W0I0_9ACTO|nr:MFS transporter [Gleimia coleocanis]EEH64039.1 transporter, major facilitator family protein [Gleimia coleocanis DSM 15436]